MNKNVFTGLALAMALPAASAYADGFACYAAGSRYWYVVTGEASRQNGRWEATNMTIAVGNLGEVARFFHDTLQPKAPGQYMAPAATRPLTVAIDPVSFEINVWHQDGDQGARKYRCAPSE